VHSTQLSLIAPVKTKPSNVPVFLIYAGIIHAIGLALLLPIVITLPGPGGRSATESAAINVEIVPSGSMAGTTATAPAQDEDQTSALPREESSEEDAAVKPEAEEPAETASPVKEKAKAGAAAATAKASPETAKKPAAARSRTAKRSVRRPAKLDSKIVPFGGALTGLFAPGAPASNRR
jgi:hypothetical protein